MPTLKHGSLYNWARIITILFLIGILLPTSSVLAKTTTAAPGAFDKTLPGDGADNQPIYVSLEWNSSTGAAGYEYCIDTVDNNVCDTSWISTQTALLAMVNLSPSTFYYWQARALDGADITYADNTAWWSFKTGADNPVVRKKWAGHSNPDNTNKGIMGKDYAVGGNLISDPSFEYYRPNPYWSESSYNFGSPLCTYADCEPNGGNILPHSGYVWAWFGGVPYPYYENASLSQTVVFPQCYAVLQFYLWISGVQAGSTTNDYLRAYVDGTPVFSTNATQWASYPTYKLVSIDVSAYGDGSAHTIGFASETMHLVDFNVDDVSLVSVCPTISGNVGVAYAALSYIDGDLKTAYSDASGNYSFPVSLYWSGDVTPSAWCHKFIPLSRSYSGVATDLTGQNYPSIACSTTSVLVGGASQGSYTVQPDQVMRQSYASLNSGPVLVTGSSGTKIIASERIAYSADGGTTWPSYSEMMGLPSGQLTTSYVMPWYNNLDLNTQLRFGNVGTSATTVTVKIGGAVQGTYLLNPNASQRISYTGLSGGPVQISSSGGVPIIASQRVSSSPDGGTTWTYYSELMGLPSSQLTTSYVMPWYNDADLNTQLRFGNVGNASTYVTVTIGGVQQGFYHLDPNQSQRISYPGLSAGPVQITSSGGVPIIASQRVAYSPDGGTTWPSFTELMGLPSSQLALSYVLPVYNNVGLNTQLRFGNVGNAPTYVSVTIAGVAQGTYYLMPSQSQRISYVGLNDGPVVIQSLNGVPIIASQRVAYSPDSGTTWSNFAEMMGLPSTQLATSYVMPWYNNADWNTQLRFGVP